MHVIFANSILDDGHVAKMGAAAWTVYAVLVRHDNGYGKSTISVPEIARLTGLSDRGSQLAIRRLGDLGFVVVESHSGTDGDGKNRYLLPKYHTFARGGKR